MKSNSSIKTVVAVGIGAALFFVLGRFVAIPSPVPNTNISLQYAVLALLATMYGPVAGGLIGFIGHALIDLSWGGSPWWSWVITSAFVGVVIGLFAKKLDVQEGEFGKGKVAVFVVANVIAHVIGWVVVAPVLDILIYAEPANKVFAQGVFAADRQLVAGQTQSLAGNILADISQLEQHAARLNDGYPVLRAAFTGTHSGAGRLLGDGLVGEDLDPDLTTTLDITDGIIYRSPDHFFT